VQYNYNTTAMQEFFYNNFFLSCIAVVLHLCGPFKTENDRRKQRHFCEQICIYIVNSLAKSVVLAAAALVMCKLGFML